MAESAQPGRVSLLDSRQQVEQHILHKATTDAQFRQTLLANPKGAIAAECGITFPETVIIHIHEETPTSLHLVVPTPSGSSDELSDEELDAMAVVVPPRSSLLCTALFGNARW
jgi:hypothetical protein